MIRVLPILISFTIFGAVTKVCAILNAVTDVDCHLEIISKFSVSFVFFVYYLRV